VTPSQAERPAMQPMELAEEEAEPCGGAAEDLGINLQNWAIDIKDLGM